MNLYPLNWSTFREEICERGEKERERQGYDEMIIPESGEDLSSAGTFLYDQSTLMEYGVTLFSFWRLETVLFSSRGFAGRDTDIHLSVRDFQNFFSLPRRLARSSMPNSWRLKTFLPVSTRLKSPISRDSACLQYAEAS